MAIKFFITMSAPRCKAASGPIDLLYERLPEGTTLGDKCKRYAVLLMIVGSRDHAHREAANFLAQLDPNDLESIFRRIDENDMIASYMKAIDEYITNRPSPAFLEIIECLRHFKSHFVKRYLRSRELTVVEGLYRLVLHSPDKKIDIRHLDLSQFHPWFVENLKFLFRSHLEEESTGSQPEEPQEYLQYIQPVSKYRRKNLKSQQAKEQLTEERMLEIRLERRRKANREGSRRYRRLNSQRYREQERLRHRRLRMIYPERIRENERRRVQRRRAMDEEEQLQLHPILREHQQRMDTQQRDHHQNEEPPSFKKSD